MARLLEKFRQRVGDAGMVADAGLAWIERQHKQAIDMKIPVVSKATEAVLQPAVLGARVALANFTSGGGRYYRPEVRDERYFSKDALRELGKSIAGSHGRSGVRADGMGSAAQFNLTQTLGGFTVKGGKVTDTFDINRKYDTVPQALTNVARAVLGKQEDPDAGKVRTEIPLDKIPGVQSASKGGDVLGNFLATDDVPETLFGFPVVTKDYTPEDIAFFKAHPEAGGYYDLSDEGAEPEDVSGALFAGTTRGKYPGAWNNPGNVRPGAVDYAGQTGTALSKKGSGRFLTFDTPQSGLNSMSNVIGQIVRVKIPARFAKGELASDKFTTRNLVSVYAPSSENNTSEYVDFVSKRLGVKPDDELNMSDSDTMAKLIDTMVRRESGHKHADWFTKDEYRKAAEMMKGAK